MTFRTARRMYGRETEPLQAMAHHRPLMLGLGAISFADERFSHAVDEEIKHLARLRAAQLVGCEWCLDFGSYLAQKAGSDPEKLRALATWRDSPLFDERECLVLEYAEAMTRTPVDVSDELFARLREHFDERQMVELTMSVALENLYTRFNWAMGIEGEGFSEGMYCVTPQGRAAGTETDERLTAA
ncbi:MAG TPA: carboxymuconolactone decarboxylase family protein [Solirubrobacteraceae bacterium]|jgi:AhpD family alkylhydroperoxidase